MNRSPSPALDDLRALVSGRPILAEGWGLRPELVASVVDSPRRMVVMVPAPGFHRHPLNSLGMLGTPFARRTGVVQARRGT
ncbi:hypothetical protein AB0I51_38435 [Streptomyces sp. NPDC050549]|uniref:hypothetical protein n=1 Tax=Streptomyces sp. NPDC050549 TaxID=3155406 RepID=UPI00342CB82D